MANEPTTILDGLIFPEGPRWHAGRLWFSDMHAHEVIAMTPDGTRETILQHDGPVSGLGWLPDGRLLVVSMHDRQLLRREADGRLVPHADLSAVATGHCNDMVVDAQGRAYVGNFGFPYPGGTPAPARLARVEPDGTVTEAAGDLMFPNGAVITPDHGTLVVAESWGGRLTAFDLAESGDLSHRRVWAPMPDGAVPDGICLDEEGAIWVASPSTSEALRVREGGEILDRIAAAQGVYACTLGGEDQRTLYLLTAADSDPARIGDRRTGRIETVRVAVAGAGSP